MQGRGRLGPRGGPPAPVTDPSPEAVAGVEDSMWGLSLEGADSYPERPGEAVCAYYMRTGFCGYGDRCRYHHPRDRSEVVVGDGDYPERIGQPVCQYYMKTGACKYGAICKYHHPKQGDGVDSSVELNYFGFPLRPGEKECTYYLKTGHCKFGVSCKFHHPQVSDAPTPEPAPAPAPAPAPSVYPQMQSSSVPVQYAGGTNWQVARPQLISGSYFQGPYGTVVISPGMVPMQSLTAYPPTVNPAASPAAQNVAASSYGLTRQFSLASPSYRGKLFQPSYGEAPSSSNQNESMFPERPGEPDCQYFLKTGDCKYGSSCRYHHPRNFAAQSTTITLNPIGLPVRPGAPRCLYFAQHGVCKFGPTCKFDHPMETLTYTQSGPGVPFMPISSHLGESSQATFVSTSLSPELRPALNVDSSFSAGSVPASLIPRNSIPSSKGSQGS